MVLMDQFTDLEINFAPAFFPKMHGKYHFHVFFHFSTTDKDKILAAITLPDGVKIDLNPVSTL